MPRLVVKQILFLWGTWLKYWSSSLSLRTLEEFGPKRSAYCFWPFQIIFITLVCEVAYNVLLQDIELTSLHYSFHVSQLTIAKGNCPVQSEIWIAPQTGAGRTSCGAILGTWNITNQGKNLLGSWFREGQTSRRSCWGGGKYKSRAVP